MKPCTVNHWMIYHINWCRVSSMNRHIQAFHVSNSRRTRSCRFLWSWTTINSLRIWKSISNSLIERWVTLHYRWHYPSYPLMRPFIGVITRFITGRGPVCGVCYMSSFGWCCKMLALGAINHVVLRLFFGDVLKGHIANLDGGNGLLYYSTGMSVVLSKWIITPLQVQYRL